MKSCHQTCLLTWNDARINIQTINSRHGHHRSIPVLSTFHSPITNVKQTTVVIVYKHANPFIWFDSTLNIGMYRFVMFPILSISRQQPFTREISRQRSDLDFQFYIYIFPHLYDRRNKNKNKTFEFNFKKTHSRVKGYI